MALFETLEKQGNWLFRWRSYLPVLILPLLFFSLRSPDNLKLIVDNTTADILDGFAFAVSILGLIIRAVTVGCAPMRTSGRNTGEQEADVLNTTGIYSVVRHPLYLANFFLFFGLLLFVQVWWTVLIGILAFWLYYERIMITEEEFLKGKFKSAFSKWADKTPAFIPSFGQWQKSALPFSLKTVLRREYTGFTQVILAFTATQHLRWYFITGNWEPNYVWLSMLGFGFLVYFVLRTIKKKSRILWVEGR